MKILAGSYTFTAGTAAEIVSKMRELYNQFQSPVSSNDEYMAGVIKRFSEVGVVVCIGTTEEEKCSSFIESLIRIKQAENITELN